MNYSFYEPYTFAVRKALKRALRGVKVPKQPYQKLYLDTKTSTSPQSMGVGGYMMALEHAWLKREPLCLLPESSALVEQILQSNFEGQLNHVEAKFNLFSIAMPKGTTLNGLVCEGLFVCISSAVQREAYIKDFIRTFDIHSPITSPQTSGKIITINYKAESDLVLNTFSAEIGRIPETLAMLKQTNKTRFEILRFVFGFLIYMSAFEDVVEDARYLNIPSLGYKQKIKQARVCQPTGHQRKGLHVRFHFRNLRHECFYRGDYEQMTPGSRWIPVKGAVKFVREAR